MKIVRRFPILGSSQDPEKISLTVKSVGLALVPVAIGIAGFYGVELAKTDLVQLVDQVAIIVSGVGLIYGLLRKIIINL